jgi:hypothetical protein
MPRAAASAKKKSATGAKVAERCGTGSPNARMITPRYRPKHRGTGHGKTEAREGSQKVEVARVRKGKTGASSKTDSILAVVGSGKHIWADEHADAYVARLREGWD